MLLSVLDTDVRACAHAINISIPVPKPPHQTAPACCMLQQDLYATAQLLSCRKMFLQTPYRHEIHSDVQERITEAFDTDCEFREIAACYTQSGDIITFQLLFLPVSLLNHLPHLALFPCQMP